MWLINLLRRFIRMMLNYLRRIFRISTPAEKQKADDSEAVKEKYERLERQEQIESTLDKMTLKAAPDTEEYAEEHADKDDDTFHSIVLMVSKAFDYNPRKVKQFVNIFRLRAATGAAIKLFEREVTYQQLGKCVAIRLQWPLFMRAVEREPALFETVVMVAENGKNENADKVVKYWCDKEQLVGLIKVGCCDEEGKKKPEEERTRFSLKRIDIERLLGVSGSAWGQPDAGVS